MSRKEKSIKKEKLDKLFLFLMPFIGRTSYIASRRHKSPHTTMCAMFYR